jgi:hypothetical protein
MHVRLSVYSVGFHGAGSVWVRNLVSDIKGGKIE